MKIRQNNKLQFKSIKTGEIKQISVVSNAIIFDNKALDDLPMTSESIKVRPNVHRNTR